MDDLQAQLDALFRDELQDGLQRLTDGIAALLDPPSQDAAEELARGLFRTAHSLKGAAHAAGVTAAMAPCHRLEDLLTDVRTGERPIDADLVSALRGDVDALMTVEQSLGRPSRATSDLHAELPAPVQPPPAGDPTRPPGGGQGRARVNVRRLDQLVDRSSALVVATERVGALAAALMGVNDDLATAVPPAEPAARTGGHLAGDTLHGLARQAAEVDRHLRRLAAEVADTAQQLRLQPFADVVIGLDRSVREVAEVSGTDAELRITGGDVEMDRDIGEAIREVLLHLVRNAVDHGLETPAGRATAGKPPTGTVHVAAAVDADRVVITVEDDGSGVDVAALREQAGQERDGGAGVELAFRAGLSTAAAVTEVSGRGVGLDAVRATMDGLGGTVTLASDPGVGTTVTLRVPRSLAVVDVHVAQVGDHVVALLSEVLTRLHRFTDVDVSYLEGRAQMRIGETSAAAVPLGAALGLPGQTGRPGTTGIAVETAEVPGLLVVDDVLAPAQVVLKPLPQRFGHVTAAVGAGLLPDGRPVVVVNPAAALRDGLATAVTPAPASAPPRRAVVLLAEDTLTTRALERSILESAGYEVRIAVDGAEAWRLLNDDDTIDLVVSDVDMPKMSGIQLCETMRSSGAFADIPVVLVTSLASEEDRVRGLAAGANAYIVKSAFEQRALLDAVARLL